MTRAAFKLTSFVVIGTDCICSCNSHYHPITTTTAIVRPVQRVSEHFQIRYIMFLSHFNSISIVQWLSVLLIKGNNSIQRELLLDLRGQYRNKQTLKSLISKSLQRLSTQNQTKREMLWYKRLKRLQKE